MRNISKDFTNDKQSDKCLNGIADDFWVDHISIKKENILNIHQYLMFKNDIKKSILAYWKMVIRLLNSILNASKHTKCIFK